MSATLGNYVSGNPSDLGNFMIVDILVAARLARKSQGRQFAQQQAAQRIDRERTAYLNATAEELRWHFDRCEDLKFAVNRAEGYWTDSLTRQETATAPRQHMRWP